MFTFTDLVFVPRAHTGGIQAIMSFPNGYGISVIRHSFSYGHQDGLYECAVLSADGSLCYSTPVTSDVIGHCSPDDITRIMGEIAALPQDSRPVSE